MSEHANEETLYGDNMEQVADWGDNVPPGKWYHVRVDKVKTHEPGGEQMVSKASGLPICQVNLKVQDEPFVGKVIVQQPSLQSHALFQLKAFYKAANYQPGPGGHNPHKLLNAEFYVKPEEEVYQGEKRLKVPPYGVKPLSEGRPVK